jgi:PKD-like domain
MMMFRKSLWFGLAVAVTVGTVLSASSEAQAQSRSNRASAPPTLSLSVDQAVIRGCEGDAPRVKLFANATSSSGSPLRYKWTVNEGRITGSGANTTWDLLGAQPGVYYAVVEVDDGIDPNCVAFSSVAVMVTPCPPPPPEPPTCPTVTVTCPDSATENAPVTFSANVSGGSPNVTPIYNWTVSAGRITSGQGTESITVDTTGLAGQTIRATLDVGGYGMPCPASCTVSIPIDIKPRKFDEYYDIARNDEKARLDNYAIQLQSEPGSQGYIIVYPSRKAKADDAQERATRISDYLINSRGIDASRFTITMGAARDGWMFELWIVPQGAPPPVPQR